MPIKVKRQFEGSYKVTVSGFEVTVDHFVRSEGAAFDGWIARALWDAHTVTDPLSTKREAVAEAKGMLADRLAGMEG